ncbi:MAG: hypothetical protein HFF70_01790 [Oscillospiraceae bacterium]|nr:hypothetical protein [Oscillospiraceae bacterium]
MKNGLLAIKKALWLLFTAAVLLALPACGGSGETDSGAPKMVSASGDMVTAELPSGWSLVSGTDMNGVDLADFICHAEKFELGDPYLQAQEYFGGIEAARAVLESEDPYGTYAGTKELANGTWYLAENAAAAQLGEKALLVKGYQCDFGSEEVQSILGSLQWVQ